MTITVTHPTTPSTIPAPLPSAVVGDWKQREVKQPVYTTARQFELPKRENAEAHEGRGGVQINGLQDEAGHLTEVGVSVGGEF